MSSVLPLESHHEFAVSRPPMISRWNRSRGKRIFDFLLGGAGLLVCLPLMALVALVVRLSSAGPVFYRQWRVGQDNRPFQLLKFRTMTAKASPGAPSLTRAGDNRITRVGRVLRRWKLDELPQLLNVVAGQMSLVGPRPDLSEYLEGLDAGLKQVSQLRPGITGWASIHYRNEEELLAQVPASELKQFYCARVLPDKVRLDLEYAAKASLVSDCALLCTTLRTVVSHKS